MVGSFMATTILLPSEIINPFLSAITAPNGPSPFLTLYSAISHALLTSCL
jgi:hypothetical protein